MDEKDLLNLFNQIFPGLFYYENWRNVCVLPVITDGFERTSQEIGSAGEIDSH